MAAGDRSLDTTPGRESFSIATRVSSRYSLSRGMALGCCIPLRFISGMVRGSFTKKYGISGLAVMAQDMQVLFTYFR